MKQIKQFIQDIKHSKYHKFTVRTEVLWNGFTIHTPMVKMPGIFSRWVRIVQVDNDRYYAMELPNRSKLTELEAFQYVVAYKAQLRKESQRKQKATITFRNAPSEHLPNVESFTGAAIITT